MKYTGIDTSVTTGTRFMWDEVYSNKALIDNITYWSEELSKISPRDAHGLLEHLEALDVWREMLMERCQRHVLNLEEDAIKQAEIDQEKSGLNFG